METVSYLEAPGLIFRVISNVWTFGVILNAGVFDEIKVEYSKMNGNSSFVV